MKKYTPLLLITSLLLSVPAFADKGVLRITTDPGDAKIYVNGKRKGNSPPEPGMSFAIQLDEGEYTISAQKADGEYYEYKGEKKDIFLADDTIQAIKIELKRQETEAGRLAREAKEEKERQEKLAKAEKERQEYLAELKRQGRSYTKLSLTGEALPDSAKQWSCVKDNKTGLVWEVKTDDGGIHDKDNTYRWGGLVWMLRQFL